jgi:hypothetical protein
MPLPNVWLLSGASVVLYVLLKLKAHSLFYREFNSTFRNFPGLSSWNLFTGNMDQLIFAVCLWLYTTSSGAQATKGSNKDACGVRRKVWPYLQVQGIARGKHYLRPLTFSYLPYVGNLALYCRR